MNREQAKKFAHLIQAFAEGETIQFKNHRGEWRDISEPVWTIDTEYRIKPEPVKFWVCHYTSGGVPMSITSDPKDAEEWKKYPHLYDVREYTYEKE